MQDGSEAKEAEALFSRSFHLSRKTKVLKLLDRREFGHCFVRCHYVLMVTFADMSVVSSQTDQDYGIRRFPLEKGGYDEEPDFIRNLLESQCITPLSRAGMPEGNFCTLSWTEGHR